MEAMLSVFNLGMLLLLIAWLLQLTHSKNGEKAISRWFMAVYGLGALSITLNGLMEGLIMSPILNLLLLLVVLAVMVKTVKKSKKK